MRLHHSHRGKQNVLIFKRLYIIGGVMLLVSTGAISQDFRDTITAVTPTNFDSGGEISRQFHLNAESYLPMATIYAPMEAKELLIEQRSPIGGLRVSHRFGETTFAEYVTQDDLIDGVIILQDGQVVFEDYSHMERHQRHFAWSVTKILTSTALASLAEQGRVDMAAPIDQYLPVLVDSGWSGVSVQDIANMASAIDCLDSDGYQDTTTCIYTLEEALGITAPTGRDPEFIKHLQSMSRSGVPGKRFEYTSANTNVLALLIEEVTQKQFSEAVRELVWVPIGAEADGMMAISDTGFAYGSGGLHARLRDIARVGQVYAQPDVSGVLAPKTVRSIQQSGVVLSKEQLAKHKKILGEDIPERAGWQWDFIWSDGAMYKYGYSGQGLYVDPARNLVIAWFGTGLNYNETRNEMLPISRQLARALD